MVQSSSISLLIRKLKIDEKEFITNNDLLEYCKYFKLDYTYATGYLLRKGILTRIFRGVFYVKTYDEIKLHQTKYTHLELLAKGIELKQVKEWYFGLYTALKLNNMTHEYYAIETVISDKILRLLPISIAGYKFSFTKISDRLFGFGIISKETRIRGTSIKYSNPEKTILDFIYLWKYEGMKPERVLMDIEDWMDNINLKKLKQYSNYYPKTVQRLITEWHS